MRIAAVVVAAAAACGPKSSSSKTPPVPPDQPIGGLADLAGEWKATDADGWTYRLTIGGDGAYAQSIERAANDTCQQKGKLQGFKEAWGQDYDPRNFGYGGAAYGGTSYGGGGTWLALVLTLDENKCNPDFTGAQLVTFASSFTGGGVVLRTGQPGGAQETHHYSRVITPPAR